MKNVIRLLFHFLLIAILSFPLSAQVNHSNYILGLKSNHGRLIQGDAAHPVVNSLGFFIEYSFKRIALHFSQTYGKQSKYVQTKTSIFSPFGLTSIESMVNSISRYFTTECSIKIPFSKKSPNNSFFFETGIQSRRGKLFLGSIKTNTITGNVTTTTYRIFQPRKSRGNQFAFNLALGIDHYFDKSLYVSGQLGWRKYYSVVNNDFTVMKDLGNFFFEFRIGYILFSKKSKS